MSTTDKLPAATNRRTLLRRGARLAYIAPVVVVALKAESAFAASTQGRGGPSPLSLSKLSNGGKKKNGRS